MNHIQGDEAGANVPAGQRSLGAPDRVTSDTCALADTAALGLALLAATVARTKAGITVTDTDRHYVYANPAACQMLGYPIEHLRGRDLLESFPVREHPRLLAHLPHQHDDGGALFTCSMLGADGAEREIVYSTFAVDVDGTVYRVGILRDHTDTREASRTAVALAQTAAQLVGTANTSEILAGIARHAVEGTRAVVCGIPVVDANQELAAVGSYFSPNRGSSTISAEARTAAWNTFSGLSGDAVVRAMTAGAITIGEVPGRPVVLSDARSVWEADPVTQRFARLMHSIRWQAGVFVPLSSENRVFGFFGVLLPSELSEPSEAELAFYTALADQAAVVVTNARLSSQAAQAAAVLERARLARELHDSVSQALFSMTMHARAAQLAMVKAGLTDLGPLERSILELVELTRGAMAEMRALIFELRPDALAEEGLIAALSKQGAALTAREQIAVNVQGPEQRLDLDPEVEEHLYRIVSEAVHNVVKHAQADSATVTVTLADGSLKVTVVDDGSGFDTDVAHAGRLGLSTMAERARLIGATLNISSALGSGTTVVLSLSLYGRDQEQAAPVAH